MDGYYERFGQAPDPVLFTYDIFLTTPLITWIYNHTGRSILAAILFHFVLNFSEEIVSGSPEGHLVVSLLNTVVVAVILWKGVLKPRR